MNANSKFLYNAWRVFFALIFGLSAAGLSAQRAQAAGYVVSNLNPSGAGSLRQAIINANNHVGADTITFTVSGTITLTAALPAISDNVTIDGTGQNVTVNGDHLYRVFSINSGKTVTLNTLTISNGYGGMGGGGAVLNYGTLIVRSSTFSGNTASNSGGAIYNEAVLRVFNSTFINNSASYGGGIENHGGSLTVVNSTFSANRATVDGGGIDTFSAASSTVINTTFSGNTAANNGGGIYVSNDSELTLNNSIVANSTSGGDCVNAGTFAGGLANLIETNSGCGIPASTADPMLVPLTNNGGATKTFALYVGSPAIDTGDDATCAAAPVNNLDQRGQTRPYGAHCDMGSVEVRNEGVSKTFRSVGAHDGWVLESGENTNVGGSSNADTAIFNVGDGAGDRQYRAILSFNTSTLPDNAIITNVTLKIKKDSPVGTDPFTILGGLKVDMRKPYFGATVGLVIGDFQAAAGRSEVATFNPIPVDNWYSAVLISLARAYVNKKGPTQFRVYFTTDDNDDRNADYMKFYSGNHPTASFRPMLFVEYYLP